MLSCSLDPDQDLQSGSKLFTWYDVYCNIRGGDYVLDVKFSGGLCPSCKIQRGRLCPSCKIYGVDFVPVYKKEQGGGLSYTRFSHLTAILNRYTFCMMGNVVWGIVVCLFPKTTLSKNSLINTISACRTVWFKIRSKFCQASSGSKLFEKIISRGYQQAKSNQHFIQFSHFDA